MKIHCCATIILGIATVQTKVEAGTGSLRSNRKLQLQLVGYGGRPPANRFPLQLCEGDCDNDDQCDVGLICFQRNEPAEGEAWSEVPGCIGGSDFTAKTDFCIMAPVEAAEEVITMAPTYGSSAELDAMVGPTGEDNMELGVTSAPTTMPLDEGNVTMMPTSAAYWDLLELEFVRWDNAPGDIPLGLCQGDCDWDGDCLDELVCFKRTSEEYVPGCRGSPGLHTDFCVKPSTSEPSVTVETTAPTEAATMGETEMIVALETVGDTNEGLPLGLCQGDCDTNADCLDDLICFQRDALESVPGCAGSGSMSYDYCILDPNKITMNPTEFTTVTTVPMQTEAPSATPLVGTPVVVTLEPVVIMAAEAPSAAPMEEPMLVSVGKEKDGELLGLCEGDCNDDDDCAEGLVCLDRDSEDEVPGCGGEPRKGDDYCVPAPQF